MNRSLLTEDEFFETVKEILRCKQEKKEVLQCTRRITNLGRNIRTGSGDEKIILSHHLSIIDYILNPDVRLDAPFELVELFCYFKTTFLKPGLPIRNPTTTIKIVEVHSNRIIPALRGLCEYLEGQELNLIVPKPKYSNVRILLKLLLVLCYVGVSIPGIIDQTQSTRKECTGSVSDCIWYQRYLASLYAYYIFKAIILVVLATYSFDDFVRSFLRCFGYRNALNRHVAQCKAIVWFIAAVAHWVGSTMLIADFVHVNEVQSKQNGFEIPKPPVFIFSVLSDYFNVFVCLILYDDATDVLKSVLKACCKDRDDRENPRQDNH